MTESISKLLHSWLFIDLSEHHYTTQTSKFNNFFNSSATMLNNVFNFRRKSKHFRTKKWKLDENQSKYKEVMTLWSSQFSSNISWPVDMNMQMSELIMSSSHNFPFILYTEWKCQTCLNSSLNRCRIMLTPIYLYMKDKLSQVWAKYYFFSSKFYVQNIWQVVRLWHHQLTHLYIYIDISRNVSWKFVKLHITSLFFNRFSSSYHCFVKLR